MAQLSSFGFIRHVRGEPTTHLMHLKRGKLKQRGRGVSFWFAPLGSNLVEVPLDDREMPFLFNGRSRDFQEVVVQGVVSYRIREPEVIAERVNFAIDPDTGRHREQPLDSLALTLTQLAQQLTVDHLTRSPLAELLAGGLEAVRRLIDDGLRGDEGLAAMGLEVVSTRVASLQPSREVEQALETPQREQMQQRADEATFARRALAVEKERAIQENELQNQIELARREEQLIDQRGQNERRKAEEQAEAERVRHEAEARDLQVTAEAEARAATLREGANNDAERTRIDIYRDLSSEVLLGLAGRELAQKLRTIEHLNITPELLSPLLARLLEAGTTRLEE